MTAQTLADRLRNHVAPSRAEMAAYADEVEALAARVETAERIEVAYRTAAADYRDLEDDRDDLRAKVARVEALRGDIDAARLRMCRACRDPEFARIHSHDCGQTRKWFTTELRAALDGAP